MSEANHKKGNTSPPLTRHCSLLLPGVLDLSITQLPEAFAQVGRVPGLEAFFSRAQRHRLASSGLEASLFALFEVATPVDQDLPVAAVCRQKGDGQWWLCADPVQLIPDRDQLVLFGPESLALSQAEADQLVNEINTQLAGDPWHIEAHSPCRWYLHQPRAAQLRTYPLAQVRGCAIGEYLPMGTDAPHWRRLMNELQMVLHNSVVNREREAMGQPTVNSLWFWGGGLAPSVAHSRWSQLWSDEPLSQGLASLSSTPRQPLPADAESWLQQAIAPGEHLLVLDVLAQHWQRGDRMAWAQQVRNLNREWLMPLLKALRDHTLNELSIYTCDGRCYSLTRHGLWRWWRRKRPLLEIAVRR